jgi:phosphoribosylformimino-5-aminoimidazole carboxamide ribotide isomerase
VDLDAALEKGDNLDTLTRIAGEAPGEVQVGGGVRTSERAAALFSAGASRVIVGTRAVDDRKWLGELAERFREKVMVAADIRDGKVLRRGWTEASELRVEDFLAELAELPLAGILCTDVGREGQVKGIDRGGVATVLAAARHPLWVSGGVTTMDELRFLRKGGAAGAVLGMALYTGVLDADQVAEEFGG